MGPRPQVRAVFSLERLKKEDLGLRDVDTQGQTFMGILGVQVSLEKWHLAMGRAGFKVLGGRKA